MKYAKPIKFLKVAFQTFDCLSIYSNFKAMYTFPKLFKQGFVKSTLKFVRANFDILVKNYSYTRFFKCKFFLILP